MQVNKETSPNKKEKKTGSSMAVESEMRFLRLARTANGLAAAGRVQ
jgi:hypothetical protein